MKNETTIPVLKVEDLAALERRRVNYATNRDLLAQEFNDAIAKRLLQEAKNVIKCDRCGKEFESGKAADASLTCPECVGKE